MVVMIVVAVVGVAAVVLDVVLALDAPPPILQMMTAQPGIMSLQPHILRLIRGPTSGDLGHNVLFSFIFRPVDGTL